jgi:hypothetical protein
MEKRDIFKTTRLDIRWLVNDFAEEHAFNSIDAAVCTSPINMVAAYVTNYVDDAVIGLIGDSISQHVETKLNVDCELYAQQQ